MQLWMVRHGQNVPGADGPLTPEGENQAELTGQKLENAGITHVLSSPLIRTLKTASIINSHIGNLPIEVWPLAREGLGRHHKGPHADELLAQFPGIILPEGFATEDWDQGGDTYDTLVERAESVLRDLKKRFREDERVLLASHGGFINFMLHQILHIPTNAAQWFELSHCSICHIELRPRKQTIGWSLYPHVDAVVHIIGDVSHLPSNEQQAPPPEND